MKIAIHRLHIIIVVSHGVTNDGFGSEQADFCFCCISGRKCNAISFSLERRSILERLSICWSISWDSISPRCAYSWRMFMAVFRDSAVSLGFFIIRYTLERLLYRLDSRLAVRRSAFSVGRDGGIYEQ